MAETLLDWIAMHLLTERGHRDVKKLLLGRTPGVAIKYSWDSPRSKNPDKEFGGEALYAL